VATSPRGSHRVCHINREAHMGTEARSKWKIFGHPETNENGGSLHVVTDNDSSQSLLHGLFNIEGDIVQSLLTIKDCSQVDDNQVISLRQARSSSRRGQGHPSSLVSDPKEKDKLEVQCQLACYQTNGNDTSTRPLGGHGGDTIRSIVGWKRAMLPTVS
jgi:hypothetical protein